MEHLCCDDNRLLLHHTLAYNLALNARYLLYWHLYTKVATRNHNAIRGINNLINIIYSFLIFNL